MYLLEANNPFKQDHVYRVIRNFTGKEMEGVKYDPRTCVILCLTLSAELLSRSES
jgi:hypothetical protein